MDSSHLYPLLGKNFSELFSIINLIMPSSTSYHQRSSILYFYLYLGRVMYTIIE